MYTYRAHVLRVVDGDTVFAVIDLGFFITMTIDVRLAFINTPELKSSDIYERNKANIAKQKLIDLVEGKDIFIKSHKKDKYGRWLGELFLCEKDSVSINTMMIDKGYAEKYICS